MEEKQRKLVELLNRWVPEEGIISEVMEGVDIFRIVEGSPREAKKYEPQIIILAQGQKRIFIGDQSLVYDPMHYLVLSVPIPLECEVYASSEKPLLGLTIKVDPKMISAILLTLDDPGDSRSDKKETPAGIYSASVDDFLLDASIRMLKTLSSRSDSRFLGPMIVKEIVYRVLTGENGASLRALAYRDKKFFQIARILDKIHDSCEEKIDLNSLALEAGMSVSSFHSNFKAVTNTSPLQYIKDVKLHKAKLLMQEEGVNAYTAAHHVGYESPSQFSREYKRLFGLPPGKDVRLHR